MWGLFQKLSHSVAGRWGRVPFRLPSAAALAAASWAVGAHAACAAEAILRPRVEASSAVVRLGDLAEIEGASARDAARLADRIVTLAPPPGETRYLRRPEILDLLSAEGLDDVTLAGSEVVEVRRRRAASAGGDDAAPRRSHSAAAVEAAIVAYLAEVSGHGLWKAEVAADNRALDRLPAGLPLRAEGGLEPWTGRQEFQIGGGDASPPVAVFARVTRTEHAVVAVRSVERGQLLTANDVELQELDQRLPPLACRTLDDALGREARQALRPGTVVQTSQVHAPTVVRRGETVAVVARAEGVSVKALGQAREDGGLGDLIQVESTDGRRRERFMARVVGRKQCEVYAAGVDAEDLARRQ
jgi:flagella basal body P-ring formation protein FlgA